MKPATVDPERIAALIDGRLDATQRARILAELEASPEALEIYADAVAALRESSGSEDSSGGGTVTPLDSHRRNGNALRAYGLPIAIAAVLVIAVAVPLMRRSRDSALGDSFSVAVALPPTGDLGAALLQRTPWSEFRGASEALTPRPRAVRIGVRIVDLGLLVRAHDSTAIYVAGQVASLLDGIPAGSVAAAEFRSLANATNRTDETLRRAASLAEQVAGVTEVRAGAWLEAARAAAALREATFFGSAASHAAMAAVRRLVRASPQPSDAMARLEHAAATFPQDWPAIDADLREILRFLAMP